LTVYAFLAKIGRRIDEGYFLGAFAQRARAAFRADSLRCSAVSLLAVALPPLRPNFARYFDRLLFLAIAEPQNNTRSRYARNVPLHAQPLRILSEH
jgi:hypothetical protein